MPSTAPIGVIDELESIDRRRKVADALRLAGLRPPRMDSVNGMLLPDLGLDKVFNSYIGNRDSDELDKRQKQVISGAEARQADAMRGLMSIADPYADGPQPTQDEIGAKAAAAFSAGVPSQLVESVLKQRQGYNQLQRLSRMDGSDYAAPGAPAGQAPSGGGPVSGFLPGAQQPQPQGGSAPFANVSDKKLLLMTAMDGPAAKIAAGVLKMREAKVEGGIVINSLGDVIGPATNAITDVLNVREKNKAAAGAKYQAVTRKFGEGQEETLPADVFAAKYGNGAGPQPAGGGMDALIAAIPLNEKEMGAIGDILTSRGISAQYIPKPDGTFALGPRHGTPLAPPQQGDNGTLPASEIEARKLAKETAALRERSAIPRFESTTNQYVTGDPNQAPGTAVTPAGMQPKLTSEQSNQLTDIRVTANTLRKLQTTFKPEYVGFKGSVGGAVDQYGSQVVPGVTGDPARVKFRQNAATVVNNYIKAVTGATVGQNGEQQRLMKAVPTDSDSPVVYEAKMQEMAANLEQLPSIIANNPNLGGGAPKPAASAAGGKKTVKWSDLP